LEYRLAPDRTSVSMISADTTTIHQLRASFQRFWDSQLQIEPTSGGLVLALPVMDADGWQVTVHLEPVASGKWRLTDHGKTLSHGLPSGAKGFKERLSELAEVYRFQREGLELVKMIAEPFDPVEIQVFAEGLAAV